MEYLFRLTKGQDLRLELENYVKSHQIDSCVVICAVGSLLNAQIRLADGKTIKNFNQPFEIVSLMGTLAKGKAHLHLSVADEKGLCIGGHLAYNTLINTTCEVVLLSLENYELDRAFDKQTGYQELTIKEKGK